MKRLGNADADASGSQNDTRPGRADAHEGKFHDDTTTKRRKEAFLPVDLLKLATLEWERRASPYGNNHVFLLRIVPADSSPGRDAPMPDFTFEIIERGKVRPNAIVLALPDQRALWGSVEALSLRLAGWQGAFIRVRCVAGDTLVRAGISTALASIENCPAEDCLLKKELKHFQATGRHSESEPGLVVDCAVLRAKLAA